VNSSTIRTLLGVWCGKDGGAWAVGENGVILLWDGLEWSLVSKTVSNKNTSVFGVSQTSVLIADDSGKIGTLRDASFYQIRSPSSTSIVSMWGFNASDIWLAALDGSLWHFDGIGTTKETSFQLSSGESLSALWGSGGSGSSVLFAISSAAPGVPLSTAKVQQRSSVGTWTNMTPSIGALWPTSLSAVWGGATNDLWVAGQDRTFHLTGSWDGPYYPLGKSDVLKRTSAKIDAIWGNSTGNFWFGGWVTTNLGTIAETTTSNVIPYAQGKWGSMVVLPDTTDVHLWGTAGNDVWAALASGKIFHFDGQAWTLKATPTSVGLNAIHGFDSQHVWAVGDEGKILQYRP
jgi:hypothetical protein